MSIAVPLRSSRIARSPSERRPRVAFRHAAPVQVRLLDGPSNGLAPRRKHAVNAFDDRRPALAPEPYALRHRTRLAQVASPPPLRRVRQHQRRRTDEWPGHERANDAASAFSDLRRSSMSLERLVADTTRRGNSARTQGRVSRKTLATRRSVGDEPARRSPRALTPLSSPSEVPRVRCISRTTHLCSGRSRWTIGR